MNFYSALVYTSLVLTLAACNGAGRQERSMAASDQAGATASNSTSISTASADSIALTTLIRNMYAWHEESFNGVLDFDPKKVDTADTVYKSIDWTNHHNIQNKLKRSGFFAAEFLENYQYIAQQIDTALKSGKTIWPEGELPSFGNDADPWCSCQDVPAEHYWEILTLTNIQFDKNSASFQWIIADDYKYSVKAKKEKGIWKIAYLEGFDLKNYVLQ